jgi:hypothetical protein
LKYDSSNKEAELHASMTAKITAGTKALAFNIFAGVAPFSLEFKNVGKEQDAVYNVGLSASGCPTQLSAGASVTCTVAAVVNPNKLFAGQYFARINPALYISNNRGGADTFANAKVIGQQTTKNITIIGERAPYLIRAWNDATPNVNVTLTGNRFHSTQNVVTLNGISKVVPSYDTFKDISSLSFQVTDFGITSAGDYPIKVSTPEGVSNLLYIMITNAPTQVSAQPIIRIIGSPTIRLEYDSSSKESKLVSEFSYSVTAGNRAISKNMFPNSPIGIRFEGDGRIPDDVNISSPNGVSGDIQPGQTYNATIRIEAKPGQMFPGQYRAVLLPTLYVPLSNGQFDLIEGAAVEGQRETASLTVVGERSPWISSAGYDGGGNFVISGSRFGSYCTVYIGSNNLSILSVENSTKLIIPADSINQFPGGEYPLTVSNVVEGLSNRIYVGIKG